MNAMSRWSAACCWICLTAALGWVIVGVPLLGWNPVPMFLASVPVALILSVRRHGARGALIYWVAAIVISNAWENLSIITGFPFGHYHYTSGPKIALVPAVIGPVYASLGYMAWTVASWILGQADRKLGQLGNIFVLPLIAGAVMTMWDVVTDPQASTFGHEWIWERGGNVFGVPECNFLGWWLVTYSFFQVFTLCLWLSKRTPPDDTAASSNLVPILFYGVLGLSVLVDSVSNTSAARTVQDNLGVAWRYDHLLGTMAVMTLFTMAFATLVALQRWREAVYVQRAEAPASAV